MGAGGQREDSILDAVGPDRPTFLELVQAIRTAVGSRAPIVRVPGSLVPPISSALNLALHDVLLTRDEYRAMADGLADTDGPGTAPTSITDWLADHAATIGSRHVNELERHFDANRGPTPTR